MSNPYSFSNLLLTHRQRLGLTQEQAAEVLAIPQRTYSDWERGTSCPAMVTQEGALARLKDCQKPIEPAPTGTATK